MLSFQSRDLSERTGASSASKTAYRKQSQEVLPSPTVPSPFFRSYYCYTASESQITQYSYRLVLLLEHKSTSYFHPADAVSRVGSSCKCLAAWQEEKHAFRSNPTLRTSTCCCRSSSSIQKSAAVNKSFPHRLPRSFKLQALRWVCEFLQTSHLL
jgi:hypothetical protein